MLAPQLQIKSFLSNLGRNVGLRSIGARVIPMKAVQSIRLYTYVKSDEYSYRPCDLMPSVIWRPSLASTAPSRIAASYHCLGCCDQEGSAQLGMRIKWHIYIVPSRVRIGRCRNSPEMMARPLWGHTRKQRAALRECDSRGRACE